MSSAIGRVVLFSSVWPDVRASAAGVRSAQLLSLLARDAGARVVVRAGTYLRAVSSFCSRSRGSVLMFAPPKVIASAARLADSRAAHELRTRFLPDAVGNTRVEFAQLSLNRPEDNARALAVALGSESAPDLCLFDRFHVEEQVYISARE